MEAKAAPKVAERANAEDAAAPRAKDVEQVKVAHRIARDRKVVEKEVDPRDRR